MTHAPDLQTGTLRVLMTACRDLKHHLCPDGDYPEVRCSCECHLERTLSTHNLGGMNDEL